MRINRYIAAASGLSRRKADKAIGEGRVKVDGQLAQTAQTIEQGQIVTLDDMILTLPVDNLTIALNKPVGYVVSRNGQGAQTIYSLLPEQYQSLKAIGRLDKDSSGLLLMSNDGLLIQSLAHPSFNKVKTYEVTLDRVFSSGDQKLISNGVNLTDGLSKLNILSTSGKQLKLSMEEGRNRQIRRTFAALDYQVVGLERTAFGKYSIDNLKPGQYREVKS